METTPPLVATRERILGVALELFAKRGYLRTSVQEIAERVGVTKAAVHYHFPRKIDIMLSLAEPVWRDFETMIDKAERLPDPRWPAIEGWLDVLLKHRRVFEMITHDPAMITDEKTYAYMFTLLRRVLAVFAGPDPAFGARMRAAQAMAVLSDPVFLFPEVPDHILRAEALAGVRRLLADESFGPAAPRHDGSTPHTPNGPLDGGRLLSGEGNTSPPAHRNGHTRSPLDGGDGGRRRPRSDARSPIAGPLDGGRLLSGEGNTSPPEITHHDAQPRARRRPGRPAALTDHGRQRAHRMHAAGLPAEQIAANLGVSRATVYRYLQT